MLRNVFTLAANRRAKWIIIPLFVLLAGAMGPFNAKLQERSENANQRAWLPGNSESRAVIDDLERTVGGDEEQLAIITFGTRDGSKLDDEQREVIRATVADVTEHVHSRDVFRPVRMVLSPFDAEAPQRGQVAEDGSLMTAVLPIDASTSPELEPIVDELRDELDGLPSSIEAHVTGPAGLTVDSVKVFGAIDGKLLVGTVVLVLVLLLLIYRSPIIAFVPLVSVALAYTAAAGLVYLLDIDVNPQSTGILIVIMFGAGTDYCLLLVSRFREELRREADTYAAMRETLRHTSPAIISSGLTVICAMLVLLLADSDPTRSMGPTLAIGVAMTILAGLFLLPSILLALGRRAFWPMVPTVGSTPRERFNFWRRVGHVVDRRTVACLVLPVIVLVAFALGNRTHEPFLGFGSTDSFRTTTDSADGFEQLQAGFPDGELAPNVVLLQGAEKGPVDAAVAEIIAELGDSPDIGRITPDRASDDGRVQTLRLTTKLDPFGEAAADTVPGLRRDLRDVAEEHGVDVSLGGPTAQTHDSIVAAERDDRLIIPLVLGVIFLILIGLLRAIVAPVHLVASVVLSFFATLGLSTCMFDTVLDQPGTTAGFATLVFMFVVSLGVDYNIFLISRIREESHKRGTRAGTLEGLAVTGGIITSAGVILAGTFIVLATLPVLFLYQLGVAVALGVLLDTFIVRGFIVPSLMLLLGDRNWWPRHDDMGGHLDPPTGRGSSEPDDERVPAGVA
jgi:RND superfamily putative drug exporter